MKLGLAKILLLFTISFFSITTFAKSIEHASGYNIKVELTDHLYQTIYLYGYYGGEAYLFDSASSAKGKFIFKSKKRIIENGIYSIQNSTDQKLFDLIINQSKAFSVITTGKSPLNYIKIDQSEENILFFEYQKAVINKLDLTPYIETSPNSILSNYAKALQEIDFKSFMEKISGDILNSDSTGVDNIEKLIMLHYFDQIDFKDKRLLRTPLKVDIDYYFVTLFENFIEDKNDCFLYLNQFLQGTIDAKLRPNDNEVQFYYLKTIMQNYLYNKPGFDTLFVYLYDYFYKPENDQWNIFSESDQRIFKNMAERKRRILPNHTIASIEAFDIHRNKIAIDSIQTKYKILWLWDPDCDHCLIETPKLLDFYNQFHKPLNFEVIAISITEDFDRWKKYIEENKLNWVNLSYAMGEPNYDLVDFFDLMVTPGIFLIDQNNKIIDRQFPIEKLSIIFEKLY